MYFFEISKMITAKFLLREAIKLQLQRRELRANFENSECRKRQKNVGASEIELDKFSADICPAVYWLVLFQ